jgi:plasmid stability protein
MAERTTVRLPDGLVKRAKRRAAADGRSLTALIQEGLQRVLADAPSSRRVKRKLPPVSTATGGLMPGIDLNDSAALQEAEDRERFSATRR